MQHYPRNPKRGWDKWHRVCFCALVQEQHQHGRGPIYCEASWLGIDLFAEVQGGFNKFAGADEVNSLPGVPKARPEEVVVVLPSEEALFARGQSRAQP